MCRDFVTNFVTKGADIYRLASLQSSFCVSFTVYIFLNAGSQTNACLILTPGQIDFEINERPGDITVKYGI